MNKGSPVNRAWWKRQSKSAELIRRTSGRTGDPTLGRVSYCCQRPRLPACERCQQCDPTTDSGHRHEGTRATRARVGPRYQPDARGTRDENRQRPEADLRAIVQASINEARLSGGQLSENALRWTRGSLGPERYPNWATFDIPCWNPGLQTVLTADHSSVLDGAQSL